MNLNEFSTEFDVLASSYLHEGGFSVSDSSLLAFNEYEKSVYLTREQENLVLSLYSDGGSYGSFESTEQLRRDLENLLETKVIEPAVINSPHAAAGSQFFCLATLDSSGSYIDDWNLWFIVYEAGQYAADAGAPCPVDINDFPVEIVPVTHDELHRIKCDPFRGPTQRRALRLDNGREQNNYVEILPKYALGKYYVKYIRRPQPIILTDLEGSGLTINGKSGPSQCELHDSLHRYILDGAVRMAVSTRTQPTSEKTQD